MSKKEAIVDTCFFNKLSNDGKNSETDIQPDELVKNEYIQYVPKSKSVKDGIFKITAVKDSVTVKIGDDTFYPKDK